MNMMTDNYSVENRLSQLERMYRQLMQRSRRVPAPNEITPEMSQQFLHHLGTIDDVQLQNLIRIARSKGISDDDIQAGLNMMQGLRGR